MWSAKYVCSSYYVIEMFTFYAMKHEAVIKFENANMPTCIIKKKNLISCFNQISTESWKQPYVVKA